MQKDETKGKRLREKHKRKYEKKIRDQRNDYACSVT
jgi:hypothetical protein